MTISNSNIFTGGLYTTTTTATGGSSTTATNTNGPDLAPSNNTTEKKKITAEEFKVIISSNLSKDEIIAKLNEYSNKDEVTKLVDAELKRIADEKAASEIQSKPTVTANILKTLSDSGLTTAQLIEKISTYDDKTSLPIVEAELATEKEKNGTTDEEAKSLREMSRIKFCSLLIMSRPKLKGFSNSEIEAYSEQMRTYTTSHLKNVSGWIPSEIIANKLEEKLAAEQVYEATLTSLKGIINKNIDNSITYSVEQAALETKLTEVKKSLEEATAAATASLSVSG